MNLNKQMKLYQQGLAPITKTIPGRGSWERLRTRLSYEVHESTGNNTITSIHFHLAGVMSHDVNCVSRMF